MADMFFRHPIRSNLYGSRIPKRVFDLVVADGYMELEIKHGKETIRIPWDDVLYQVEAAKRQIRMITNEQK